MLRVLNGSLPADYDGDGSLDLAELHRAVSDFLRDRAIGQTPQRLPAIADDHEGLGRRPLFGQRGVLTGPRASASPDLLIDWQGREADPLRATLGQIAGVRFKAPGQDALPDLVLRPLGNSRKFQAFNSGGDLLGTVDTATEPLPARVRQLALAHRLSAIGEARRSGVLESEFQPASLGGNFRIGQQVSFVVKPERAAAVLLLDVDADGTLSVLYPGHADELAPLPARQPHFIPAPDSRDPIRTQLPYGTDIVLVFAFDSPPAALAQLTGRQNLRFDDPVVSLIERTIAAPDSRFSFARMELRILE